MIEMMLKDLERRLLSAAVPVDERVSLVHPDMCEIASNGSLMQRADLVRWLASDAECEMEFSEPHARELAAGVVLLTYRFVRQYPGKPRHLSRRGSVWVHSAAGGWQIRFHQGTLLPAEG